MARMPLRTVTFTFVEPPAPGVAGPIHRDWDAADESLRWLSVVSPAGAWRIGFVVEWADGRVFRGQGEFVREAVARTPLRTHVRRVLAILSGRRRPTPIDEQQYRKLLAAHATGEREEAAELLDDYDLGQE